VGAPAFPGRRKKIFRPNLQEKCVSAPPQDTKCTPSQSNSPFLGVFAGWLRFEGIFRRRRLKKVVNFFGKKKCTPADKILATPMVE